MALVRQRRRKIVGIVILVVVLAIIAFLGIVAGVGVLGFNKNMDRADEVTSANCGLTPQIEDGVWTFTTDEEFRILQLTDIHIGGGAFSIEKDRKAIDAVETLIKRVKPDLVIVTGDVDYPIPFQSGTMNNLRGPKMLAKTMEKLGVYWAVTLGNHDTEVYSYYDRDEIYEFYSKQPRCLVDNSDKTTDDANYVINVKNTSGEIVQSLYIMDTHSYTQGFLSDYDGLHQNQIDWYASEVARMNELNGGKLVKSMVFMHIPMREYKYAWDEYKANGHQNTENVTYYHGKALEDDEKVCCSVNDDTMFETALELGSTQGFFVGHDHLNYYSIDYKGIRLSYGMSIDHLAYIGIENKTSQRGGTIITVGTDGSMDIVNEPLVKEEA